MDIGRMTTALREILKTLLKETRLWGYHANKAAIEPICLGLLALRREKDPEIILAIQMLRDLQNANGSWSAFVGDEPAGCWTTALATLVMLAVGDRSASLATATRWLVDVKGCEENSLWRWRFQTVDNSVRFDPRKYGWSWVPGTTSWVIPTAFSLIALQQVRNAGLRLDARLDERVTLGIGMLLDRMCPGGGWNAGNGVAFGVPYSPYIDATSIALLALQGYKNGAVNASLSWLSARLGDCPSPYSLGWGILALAAYHKETEIRQALVHSSNALIEAIERDRSALDTATLAICTLALEAVDGDNVFAART
jgi:hypothetical protein